MASTKIDATVGANMATARESKGISQKELADQMREEGHKWSQATVWSVEKGDRPVRLSEAVSVAQVLGLMLADLTREPSDLRQKEMLGNRSRALAALGDKLADAAVEYDHCAMVLRGFADEALLQHPATEVEDFGTHELAAFLIEHTRWSAIDLLADEAEMQSAWQRASGRDGYLIPDVSRAEGASEVADGKHPEA